MWRGWGAAEGSCDRSSKGPLHRVSGSPKDLSTIHEMICVLIKQRG